MLKKVNVIANQTAKVAPHAQVEVFIVMLRCDEVFPNLNISTKLFLDFSSKSLLGRFIWLNLATGELPATGKIAVTTLSCQKATFFDNDRSNDVNRLSLFCHQSVPSFAPLS